MDPRMRGTQKIILPYAVAVRFIPAYAGNASSPSQCTDMLSVHPRVCGERDIPPDEITATLGSSPRMRGTPQLPHQAAPSCRFIPAYAGNAPTLRAARKASAVHPRVCGERGGLKTFVQLADGSSPRMRGTRTPRVFQSEIERFIPAYAGNAEADTCTAPSTPVHPRVCGERGSPVQSAHVHSGSSPRMRGTRSTAPVESKVRRFIPAYAGNAGTSQG